MAANPPYQRVTLDTMYAASRRAHELLTGGTWDKTTSAHPPQSDLPIKEDRGSNLEDLEVNQQGAIKKETFPSGVP